LQVLRIKTSANNHMKLGLLTLGGLKTEKLENWKTGKLENCVNSEAIFYRSWQQTVRL
jgi:hypothetical protein